MSVQTQINRISGNVSAALAAIAEKGVTVPDGSNSDALAELIASIEAGGAYKVYVGSFTVTGYSTYNYVVTHDMGVVPRVCVWAQRPTSKYLVKKTPCIAAAFDGLQGSVGYNDSSNASLSSTVLGYVGVFDVTSDNPSLPFYKGTETSVTFRKSGNNFPAATYDYILIWW